MEILKRLSPKALAIFLFHGVIARPHHGIRNYTGKHILGDVFYKMMSLLKDTGHPLSMDEVVEHKESGKPYPPYAFAVTFDDGFENNYSVAAPILDELGIPATFYITTDFVENNSMSWIDRIEYCLENCREGSLVLPWRNIHQTFKTEGEKKYLLDEVRSRVKGDASINESVLVSDIFSQCNMREVEHNNHSLDLKMNWDQVKKLEGNKKFIIGGHSHTHKILSFLTKDELKKEIRISIELLNQKAGVRVRHYSYPEGLEHCYSDEVIGILKDYGIVSCPSAEDGINYINTGLFHLKRIPVILI